MKMIFGAVSIDKLICTIDGKAYIQPQGICEPGKVNGEAISINIGNALNKKPVFMSNRQADKMKLKEASLRNTESSL